MILENLQQHINDGILQQTYWRIVKDKNDNFVVLLDYVEDLSKAEDTIMLYASPPIETEESAIELANLFQWMLDMINLGKQTEAIKGSLDAFV